MHTPDSPIAPLVALQAASQALARARVTDEGILDHLQEQARRLLPPSRIHVLLFDKEQTKLFAWDRQGTALPASYFDTPTAKSIMGWLRETKESLLVRDFERDWDKLPAKPSYKNPNPPRSAIFVPLVVADEVFGAFSAQSSEPDVYTPDHLWQLKILANQAAAAFRAGRLLRSERRRARQLETLAEVTRSVVAILDLDELLTHVVDVIKEAFAYYHVQVFVMDPATDQAVFRASSGLETHEQWRRGRRTLKRGEGMIGWVLEHGEVLVAPDVSIDPLYIPDDPRLLPDTRSEIALPLKVEDEVLGVLDVQSDRLDAFGHEDLFLLNALASAVALAVANARLYARVQEDAWVTVALLEVAEATSRLTELEEVVETITRITPMLTGVSSCAIWLQNEGATAFTPVAQRGIPEAMARLFFKHDLTRAENPAVDLVEKLQRPLVLRPPELDEWLYPLVSQALLADAIVLAPLFAKGKLIGVMAEGIEEKESPITERRLLLLKGIADQAASAIENAQLIAAQQAEAWVSTALLQVAQAIGRARDLSETLNVVARLTTTLSGLERCTILVRGEPTAGAEAFRVSMSYHLRRDLPLFEPGAPLTPEQLPLLAHLIAKREPVIVADARASDLVSDALIATYDIGAMVGLPLVASDQVVGAMLVDEREGQRVHNPRLLDILGGIAHQAAVAIERARLQEAEIEQQRIATELTVANTIQRGFLPEEVPQPPGYELAAFWEPAREIGGDFYDFIPLTEQRLGLVIADVADKGIPAALYMALSRTTLRLVSTRDPAPAEVLQRVNTAILETTYSDLFVTIFYAVLDPVRHVITYASGGHGLALQASRDQCRFLRGKGTALGILPSIRIDEFTTTLGPGDYFILYTDGVTDAVNPALELFGEERLIEVIRLHWGCPAQEMLERIYQAVRAWQGKAPRFDDFTLVVARRAPDSLA